MLTFELLAVAVGFGMILVLHTGRDDGGEVPLAYAPLLVLVTGFALGDVLFAVGVAVVAAGAATRRQTREIGLDFATIMSATVLAWAAVHGVLRLGGEREAVEVVLAALAAGCAAEITVHCVMSVVRRRPVTGSRAGLAWLAVSSSAVLMSVGWHGVDGAGRAGIVGVMLFAVPLLAVWYGFRCYEVASLTHRQTIEALALAPELAGLVPMGHTQRVASLATDVGRLMGLGEQERADLATSALLHHLGVVTLEDPELAGEPHPPAHVARVTAGTLEEIESLAPAAAIIRGETLPNRLASVGGGPALTSRILRTVSDFDDLTGGSQGRASAAIEALYAAPGYVYDSSVVGALERVLRTRGLLAVPAGASIG